MRKKWMLRALLLTLCLAMLGLCALACTTEQGNEDDPAEQPEEVQNPLENALILVQGGESLYQIIRSDYVASGSAETTMSVSLRTKVLELSTVEMAIGTD